MSYFGKCTFILGCGIAAASCAVGSDADDLSVEYVDMPPEIRNLPDAEDPEDTGGDEQSAALVAGTTSICTNSLYGPSQRYDNVKILTGTNEDASRVMLVTNAAVQRTQRSGQVVFVEAGGAVDETRAVRYGTWAYVAERGALINFGGAQAFVRDNGSVSCQPSATPNIINTAGAQILSPCTRNLQPNPPKFRRCSSTTPVAQVFPTVKIAVTRSGDNVTFRNTSRGYYESVQWSVARYCPVEDEFTWTNLSTSRTGFTANLPKSVCRGVSYQIYLRLMSPGFVPTSNWREVP